MVIASHEPTPDIFLGVIPDDIQDMEMSQEFIEFMAKLIKYNLIVFDKNLYYNMNIDEEKLKIKNTILP